MINPSLQIFIDEVLGRGVMTLEDLTRLRRGLLADGLGCREEADLLIALDRSDILLPEAWADALVTAVVDYAVWTERRTGHVSAEAASWLIASLGAGAGPTDTARRIAFEVVKEAQAVDESLLAFVMSAGRRPASTDAIDLAA